METAHLFDLTTTLAELERASADGRLNESSANMIRRWLTEPQYAEFALEVSNHVLAGKWRELDEVFWTVIPFGTGGRRGKMYPIGSNAINDRTIGESAQGLADYVISQFPDRQHACAIAYDTRHNSRHFAELCAEVMAAAGFKVYYLDGYRSTPELSFAVRLSRSSCGIMVSASHNPPTDNAVKVYWDSGVQVLPPHDARIIEHVMNVDVVRRVSFSDAVVSQKIVYCQREVDPAYIAAVKSQAVPGPRVLKIIYSPLHGVGATSVLPALTADGFSDVELFEPHARPSGDFPNIPGHIANPENPKIFDSISERAEEVGANLVLVSDPDADRIGVAAPMNSMANSAWRSFNGNQIAALLAEHILSARFRTKSLTPRHYVCKTLLTTEMVGRIADRFGVQTHGNLLVGCKWIGKEIDDCGPEYFVFGCEEAHGYLVGTHVRDKDAAVAGMLLAEFAAACRAEGKTLHEKLDTMYFQYGFHAESQVSLSMQGTEGLQATLKLMARLRASSPETLGGHRVAWIRDYLTLTRKDNQKDCLQPLEGPKGDLVILDLECEGTYVAVRPSGTEPKVKFYMFTYVPAELIVDLDDAKAACSQRLSHMASDILAYAEA